MPANRVILLHWGILTVLLPILSFAAPKPSSTKPSLNAAPPSANPASTAHAAILDTAHIRRLYMESEFDEAIAILETGLSEKRPFNHADSVFIFKHLGVMNAAKYATRELGKKYMLQLLVTEPSAKITDMYASDMIYMIFNNIQEEYETQGGRSPHTKKPVTGNPQTDPSHNPQTDPSHNPQTDPSHNPQTDPSPNPQTNPSPKPQTPEDKPKPKLSGSNRTFLWAGATGALAAAGIAAYFILSPGETKKTQHPHSMAEF